MLNSTFHEKNKSQIKPINKLVPGPRAVEAATGLAGVPGRTEAVGEAAWGTRVKPLCGRLWADGAAAAGAGLLGEFPGREGAALNAGDVAAVADGISYFWSWSRYMSAVDTAPQLTSKEFVLARTSCTREGGLGRSAKTKMQCRKPVKLHGLIQCTDAKTKYYSVRNILCIWVFYEAVWLCQKCPILHICCTHLSPGTTGLCSTPDCSKLCGTHHVHSKHKVCC